LPSGGTDPETEQRLNQKSDPNPMTPTIEIIRGPEPQERQPRISKRDPDKMNREQCLAEINFLKKSQLPGWRIRARKLITRLAELTGVPGCRFGAGPAESRSAPVLEQGPGDDPGDDRLAERVRAVMDGDRKSNTSQNCGGNSKSAEQRLLQGAAGVDWDGGGHSVPVVDFDFGAVRDGSNPTELERQAAKRAEIERAVHEATCRIVFWFNDSTHTEEQALRKVRIASHYIRPSKSQADLARELGISEGRVSQILKDFTAKISGK
jgi:hypothetical protein